MTFALTFATAIAAGWIIDRLAFRGEFVAMVGDEIAYIRSRRKPPAKAVRGARRG
jgi:hypothetical protein